MSIATIEATIAAKPFSQENLQARYLALVKTIKEIGTEAHARVAGHLRAISDGKHGNIGIYHAAHTVPPEEKYQEYGRICIALFTAAKSGDWSKLKGQLGAGAKVEEPAADLTHSLNRAVEKKEPADESQPARTHSTPVVKRNIARTPANVNITEEDDAQVLAALRKLLASQPAEPVVAPIDMDEVRVIVNEELAKLDIHEAVKKANNNGSFPTERVIKLIEDAMANQVRRVVLVQPNGELKPITGLVHQSFDTILKMTRSRTGSGHPVPVWLDGPPGGGKSHLMEQIAEALSLEAHILAIGPTDTKSAIVGSVATGTFREGIAYKPYKNGGVLGIDEIAAGDPGVLVSMNSLIANQSYRFPNGELVKKHKDFHVIVGDNTRGHGKVNGMIRNRLDAATLDRFAFLKVNYDEKLEAALCGNAKWAAYVKKVRDYILGNSAESVYITPRASINGAALLAGGLDVATVADSVLFRFCSPDLKNTIITNVGSYTV